MNERMVKKLRHCRDEQTAGGNFEKWLSDKGDHFVRQFALSLPRSDTWPSRLHEAMRYAAISNGKNLRPALIYACGEVLGDVNYLDELAIVVEAIHVYSLIHDDLPAMDDDDVRRGRPACHIAYNEGMAILCGDALQAWAFEKLALVDAQPERIVKLIRLLSRMIGPLGTVEGQAMDICLTGAVDRQCTGAELEQMHYKKTGMLIEASIMMPMILSERNVDSALIKKFGRHIGIAFQIHDDILDGIGQSGELGGPGGSDRRAGKVTYPSLLGLKPSEEHRDRHFDAALQVLETLQWQHTRLAELAHYMVARSH